MKTEIQDKIFNIRFECFNLRNENRPEYRYSNEFYLSGLKDFILTNTEKEIIDDDGDYFVSRLHEMDAEELISFITMVCGIKQSLVMLELYDYAINASMIQKYIDELLDSK